MCDVVCVIVCACSKSSVSPGGWDMGVHSSPPTATLAPSWTTNPRTLPIHSHPIFLCSDPAAFAALALAAAVFCSSLSSSCWVNVLNVAAAAVLYRRQ